MLTVGLHVLGEKEGCGGESLDELFEGFVVYEGGGVLGDFELALLDVFAEMPGEK